MTGIINEEWRSINGYLNYQVSNIGRVRNSTTGIILKPVVINTGYFKVTLSIEGSRKQLLIHRLVAQEFIDNPTGKANVDHINHNVKDNTISNLRWVSQSEDGMNQRKQQHTSSPYKGVSFNKRKNKWHAYIKINGTRKHLWFFLREKEAAAKYNEAAIELFGEYAYLNEISDDEF